MGAEGQYLTVINGKILCNHQMELPTTPHPRIPDACTVEDYLSTIRNQILRIKRLEGKECTDFGVHHDVSWDHSETEIVFLRPMAPDEREAYKKILAERAAKKEADARKTEAAERTQLKKLASRHPDLVRSLVK
jgi:hypothetical protein